MEIRATEIMVAAGARELKDGETVVVGIGLPQMACFLAKATHAPGLTPLLEIGVANMRPKHTPVGLADSRIFFRATCWSGFLDVMGMNLHRGVVDTRRTIARIQPSWRWTEPSGGTGLWVDTGSDAAVIGSALRARGVRALTGPEHFSPFGGMNCYLSLPLWYPEDELEQALQGLGDGARSVPVNVLMNGSTGTAHG